MGTELPDEEADQRIASREGMRVMDEQKEIIYCEKPDSISYDEIHEVLWKANEENRDKGFQLATAQMTGEQLKERIGDDGHCFVAMADGQVIGTLSLRYVDRNAWFVRGRIADYILSAVLPEYQGYHVNSALTQLAFDAAKRDGCQVIELDTAENNEHAIKVYEHFGFQLVGYKANPRGDHYSVIMAKWFDGCPFSKGYVRFRYGMRRLYVRLRYKENKEKRLF